MSKAPVQLNIQVISHVARQMAQFGGAIRAMTWNYSRGSDARTEYHRKTRRRNRR